MLSRLLTPMASQSRGVRSSDPFEELHREMNRLFDDFIPAVALGPSTSGGQPGMMVAPRLDVRESQQELCVSAELPGVKPEQVDVRLDGDVLTIRGEKQDDAAQDKQGFHVMERSFGQFQRTLRLPFTPDASRVRAEFNHGVLTLHIPHEAQLERSQRIPIQSGAQAPQGAGQPNAQLRDSGGADDANVKH